MVEITITEMRTFLPALTAENSLAYFLEVQRRKKVSTQSSMESYKRGRYKRDKKSV